MPTVNIYRPRLAAIDGLRTFAVLAVVLFHGYPKFFPGGGIGVDIFFTISGFVITRLLLTEYREHGRVSLGRFYTNRLLRLWPALIAICVFVLVVAPFIPRFAGDVARVPVALLYVSDFVLGSSHYPEAVHLLAHTWSLSVEEQFYLVWAPILMVLLAWRRIALRAITVIVGVAALLPTIERVLIWHGPEASGSRISFMPDTRSDQLLLGCFLALLLAVLTERTARTGLARALGIAVWPAAALLVGIVVLITQPITIGGPYMTVGLFVIALASTVLVGSLGLNPTHPITRLLSSKVLAWPGKNLSYGLYLWHFNLVYIAATLIPDHSRIAIAAAIALSVLAALGSWRFIEKPVQDWRKRRLQEPTADLSRPAPDA